MTSSGAVNVAAMADSDYLNHQAGVEHLIQDPQGADAHPVDRVLSSEGDAAGRPGFLSQQIDRRSNPLLVFPR
jgi:hypothetical protein